MRINFKKVTALLTCLMSVCLLQHSVSAADVSLGDGTEDETFMEYDAQTGEITYFTLSDILEKERQRAVDGKESKVQEVIEPDGTRYTLPSGPIVPSVSASKNEMSAGDEPRTVFTDNPSTLVSNVYAQPYCKTVLVVVKFQKPNGQFEYCSGSGAMVGNKVLLTAAHVIYNVHYSPALTPYEIRVFQRVNTTKNSEESMFNESGYFHPHSWVISSNYLPDVNANYDWCYLTMWDDIRYTYTGYYGIATNSNSNDKRNVHINGYPAVAGKSYHQYTSSGVMRSESLYRVKHRCSMESGQSGAPLYNDSYVVWAINTHHAPSWDTGHNRGTRITQALYTLLINKINETN